MSKFCPMCGQVTNCTDNCTSCLEEELKERVKALEYLTSDIDTIIDTRVGNHDVKMYPCDTEPYDCPFNARYSDDCRYHCGLGVDECGDDEYRNIYFEEEADV